MIDQVCADLVLLESAKDVFETMVFMTVEKAPEPDRKIEDRALLGSITFKGLLDGCLSFCCDIPCAQAVARNMLGIDANEQLSEEEISDAIGEVTNMVLGRVKARLHDEFANVEVSIPSAVRGRELQKNLGKGAIEVNIGLFIDDKYPARLTLFFCRKNN